MGGPLGDLRSAAFRGAPFLCPKDEVEEGPNNIRHCYPGSPVQYVESNGRYSPEFKMTCIIHGTNWLSDFSRLRSALNAVGPGTLTHPTYGRITCSVKGPWKVTRKDDDLGVFELDVTFWATTPDAIFPSLVAGIAASISTLAGGAIGAIVAGFTAGFETPSSAASQAYVGNLFGSVGAAVSAQFPSTGDVTQAAQSMSSEL